MINRIKLFKLTIFFNLLALGFLFIGTAHSSNQVLTINQNSENTKLNLNQNWLYHQGELSTFPFTKSQDGASKWQKVNLPHSYQLTSINLDDSSDDKFQKTFHRDVSWYQKTININPKPGHKVFLEFEGAHQRTELWVNGTYVAEHATSGYTPFHFDITKFVRQGDNNLITLKLDNRKDKTIPPDGHSADYVLFGGLYRDVYLVTKAPVYFSFPWESTQAGITITTPSVSHKNATVTVKSQLKNTSNKDKKIKLVTRIVDANKTVVKTLTTDKVIKAGDDQVLFQTSAITSPNLWSPASPYLYSVNSQIIENNEILDNQNNPLGLRWFEHKLGEGVLLNGKPIELIGANRHQHYPYIGDAVPNNLHRNDAIKMKQAGMNVVRLAHYPQDDAFFQACDELGILIVEEPPAWIEFGPDLWMDRLEESLRITIRNHKNHPSVWGWGAGINHRGPVKRLHYAAKEEDPYRVTMNNGTLWIRPQHSGVTDIYAVMDYRGAVRPENELLFAMEHSSSADTLGAQALISRYKGDPNLIGTAAWSGQDGYSFIKRDKEYPNLSTWTASSWDAFRLPKPHFYWYQSELTQKPMVEIAADAAQVDGKVQIFTNADQIEVFHNQKSLGKFEPEYNDKNQFLNSPSIFVPFDWQQGAITVNAYKQGKRVASQTKVKAGKASQIGLKIDTTGYDLSADGSSIVMAYVYIQDKDGNQLAGDTPNVKFTIDESAEIVGDESIGANPVRWRYGVAPVMFRVGDTPGTIKLTAQAQGLKSGTASIKTKNWSNNEKSRQSVIYDPLKLQVDLGNKQQHIQDEWQPWSVAESEKNQFKYSFTALNGQNIEATIKATDKLAWTHAWGVPGDLSFMVEDAVQTHSELTLTLANLPAGRYHLKTWHHALSGDKKAVSPLNFVLSGANKFNSPNLYQPTYGRKIKVSTAGGGNKGDGGSNKAAKGYALHTFNVSHNGRVKLNVQTQKTDALLRLNGFELIQVLTQ